MTGPTGYAPIEERDLGATALCATCCTLIREWSDGWRHCIVGMPHEARPMPDVDVRTFPPLPVHDAPAGAGDDVEAYRG